VSTNASTNIDLDFLLKETETIFMKLLCDLLLSIIGEKLYKLLYYTNILIGKIRNKYLSNIICKNTTLLIYS